MKKVLLLLFIALSFSGYSQISFPTVREVYDFAEGDTFQYRRWTSFGTNFAYCRVILSRTDYANDSIVYLSKNLYPSFIDTSRLTIGVLDSAAYRKPFGYPWGNFSTSISTYAGDTAYIAQAVSGQSRYCDPFTGYRSFILYGDYQCATGLGETFISVNDSGTAGSCAYSWYERLVYVHKTNGLVAGTPDSSLFAAIDKISHHASFILSPNPAIHSVTIETAGNPPLQTVFMLYDLTGRMVLQKRLSSQTDTIDLIGVSKGMYLYNVVSDDKKIAFGKLAVQ